MVRIIKSRLFSFYPVKKLTRGLESRNAVFGNDEGRVLGDVAGGFLATRFDDEAAEAAEIDIVAFGH